MSLVPISRWRDWWEDFERPHRLLDDHFRLALKRDELLSPLTLPRSIRPYFRPWRSLIDHEITTPVTIENDSDKFRVVLDVQQFAPNEILVKTIDNSIIVEARHDERRDDDGFIMKKFMRRYDLPPGHDVNRVMSNLSTDGILTITAPKTAPPLPGVRIVPVERTRFRAIK